MLRVSRSFSFTVSPELGLMLDQLVSLSDLSEADFINSLVTFAIRNEYEATVGAADLGSWAPVLEAIREARSIMERAIAIERGERLHGVDSPDVEPIEALEYDVGSI